MIRIITKRRLRALTEKVWELCYTGVEDPYVRYRIARLLDEIDGHRVTPLTIKAPERPQA